MGLALPGFLGGWLGWAIPAVIVAITVLLISTRFYRRSFKFEEGEFAIYEDRLVKISSRERDGSEKFYRIQRVGT